MLICYITLGALQIIMKASPISFILLLTILISIKAYSIQGNWSLTSINGSPPNSNVTLQISDYIYKNSQINQKLNFRSCQSMLLQSSFSDSQLFINFNSYFVQQIDNQTICSDNDTNLLNQIFYQLNNVFYFEIDIDQLFFNNPYANNVLSFQRIVKKRTYNITGIWNINQFGSTMTSLAIQITPTQMVFCQGNAVYNYTLFPNNTIKLAKANNLTCGSTVLISNFEASLYYRIRNKILDLYSSNVSLTVQMIYNQEYDPKNPIFGAPIAPVVATSSSGSASVNTNTVAPPFPLIGDWKILSVYTASFPNNPYYLTFTANKITINGGCGNYSFQFTVNTLSQVFTIGKSNLVGKNCSNSDDQLYISAVPKIYKYISGQVGTQQNVKLFDLTGNLVYDLQPKVAIISPPPMPPGNYILLLLQRRDLPRVFVTVTSNGFTFSLCNKYSYSYLLGNPTSLSSTIKISGGAISSNNCTSSNDKIYDTALISSVSYVSDRTLNTVILANSTGTQVVTLSQT